MNYLKFLLLTSLLLLVISCAKKDAFIEITNNTGHFISDIKVVNSEGREFIIENIQPNGTCAIFMEEQNIGEVVVFINDRKSFSMNSEDGGKLIIDSIPKP